MGPVQEPLRAAVMIKVVNTAASQTERSSEVEPLLLEVADVVNTTLDLETTLRRVAELVRKVIDYEIFDPAAQRAASGIVRPLQCRVSAGSCRPPARESRPGRYWTRSGDPSGSAGRRCHAGRFLP